MADQNQTTAEPVNYLDMSDEDLLKAPPPPLSASTETDDSASDGEADPEGGESGDGETVQESTNTPDPDKDAPDQGSSDDTAGDAEVKNDKSVIDTANPGASDEQEVKDAAKPNVSDKPLVEPEAESGKDQQIDYKAAYTKLTAPFKANGRDMAVKDVDDAIALMQMGAHYNKKMAALKPNFKLLKMLENNGLLSEEKISFLIDLDKKNPGAINKLVKDGGINPLDLDGDKASEYKQTAYTVDDQEIELDNVLDELKDSPSYNRTLEVVGDKWDIASKKVVAANPQLLKVINAHIDSGIYDRINKVIESERVFGRLAGLSDIEAYRQVGDRLHAEGKFVQVNDPRQQTTPTPVVVAPNPKKVDDDKLKDKRRAASSTKPAAQVTTPKDFNPLALSDEEFSKQVQSKYL